MTDNDQRTYPPGHQPYDRLNGIRIGALAGGVLGIIPAVVLGAAFAWLLIVFAVLGAIAGYVWQTGFDTPRRDTNGTDA